MGVKSSINGISGKDGVKSLVKNSRFLSKIYNHCFVKLKRYYQQTRIRNRGLGVLQVIHEALNAEGLTYFVDFGTLLGVVREGRFIRHDLDIDIGVMLEDDCTFDRVRRTLLDFGCVHKMDFSYKGRVVEQSWCLRGIKFDVCFYEKNSAQCVCYLFYREMEREYPKDQMNVVKMTYSLIEGTEDCNFMGILVRIPKNPERLLEEKYGESWRTPDKSWIYWKAPNAEYCDELGKVTTNVK